MPSIIFKGTMGGLSLFFCFVLFEISKNMITLEETPIDVFVLFVEYLSIKDIISLSHVSVTLRRRIKSEPISKVLIQKHGRKKKKGNLTKYIWSIISKTRYCSICGRNKKLINKIIWHCTYCVPLYQK